MNIWIHIFTISAKFHIFNPFPAFLSSFFPSFLQEGSTSKLYPDDGHISHYGEDEFALAFARIENHYFINREWGALNHVDCVIIPFMCLPI